MAPGQPAHRVRSLSIQLGFSRTATHQIHQRTETLHPTPTAQRGRRSIDVAAPPDLVYDLIADVTRMGQRAPNATDANGSTGQPLRHPGRAFVDTTDSAATDGNEPHSSTPPTAVANSHSPRPTTTPADSKPNGNTQCSRTPSGTLLTESFEFLWAHSEPGHRDVHPTRTPSRARHRRNTHPHQASGWSTSGWSGGLTRTGSRHRRVGEPAESASSIHNFHANALRCHGLLADGEREIVRRDSSLRCARRSIRTAAADSVGSIGLLCEHAIDSRTAYTKRGRDCARGLAAGMHPSRQPNFRPVQRLT